MFLLHELENFKCYLTSLECQVDMLDEFDGTTSKF